MRKRSHVALIAELKRRAPSAGSLRPGLAADRLAATYARAGAAALSVLTDRDFDGELDDLRQARGAVEIPVLRKDFILEPVQVWESRAAGADAVLLIVRALSGSRLRELLDVANEAGLGTLVEIHEPAELDVALASGAPVIGINHRDLVTFETNLEVSHRLAPRIPPDRVVVSESGIESPKEVEALGAIGVDAVLVGRALVSRDDPFELARSLAVQPRRARV